MKLLLEKEGKDPEEIIEAICQELGKGRDDLRFEVKEERGGLLRGKRFRVRAYEGGKEAIVQFVQEAVEKITSVIAPEAQVRVKREGEKISVDVRGEGCALLIGRRGQTLEAL